MVKQIKPVYHKITEQRFFFVALIFKTYSDKLESNPLASRITTIIV